MTRALVIGAGPAGSIGAICLARRGMQVTLIEQHRFPRDKVCGECLSSTGMDVLMRMGLADELISAGAIELTSTALYGRTGECAVLPMPRAMWGLTRRRLDELLLQSAGRAGASILQPARCEGIDGKSARVRMLTDNSVATLWADWVFLADGKGALLDEKADATGDFGIKAHFTGVRAPAKTIGLYALDGHYVGVAPVEGGVWNLAFSAPLGKVKRFDRNFDELICDVMGENAALAEHFGSARRATPWIAAPLPRFGVAKRWPGNVIPIGNAAAAMEPIGGEGMGLAMRSAEIAANAAGSDISDLKFEIRDNFARLWNVRSAACRLVSRVMSSPILSGPVVELVGANEMMAQKVMGLMGKM